MKEKYIPGGGCQCHAHSESECGCDVDWTPREVYELREQRDRMQHEREFFQSAFIEQGDVLCKVIEQRDRLAEALQEIANEDYRGPRPWSANIAHKPISAMKGGSDDH